MDYLKQVAVLFLTISFSQLFATNYYIKNGGSDGNPGTSDATAWASMSMAMSKTLSPGDTVFLKRGSVFSQTGECYIDDSGIKNNPVVFTSYGSGAKPILRNLAGTAWSDVFRIAANYVVIDGFRIDTTVYAGVEFQPGTSYNIVRNTEITKTGIGIVVNGRHQLVTNNYIHHLHMVVNDAVPTDNDFGATAVLLFDGLNEVSYNIMDSCFAPSYDYGEDGGAVEIYADNKNADTCYVHHNRAYNTNGLIEVGGNNGRCYGMKIAYNIYTNTRGKIAFWFHLANTFGIDIQNMRFENNTFVCYGTPVWTEGFIGWDGPMTSSRVIFENNIFYSKDWNYICLPSSGMFGSSHNCYYKYSGSTNIGFTLGTGDKITNPLFVNSPSNDYHLQNNSPAIDAGVTLAYPVDFDGKPVPFGTTTDMGAFEYISTTGMVQNSSESILSIFPNPVSSNLILSINNKNSGTVKIVNALGQILFSEKTEQGNTQTEISIENYPAGVYFVVYETEKEIIYKKLIKE